MDALEERTIEWLYILICSQLCQVQCIESCRDKCTFKGYLLRFLNFSKCCESRFDHLDNS
jgi:hypothetical protein